MRWVGTWSKGSRRVGVLDQGRWVERAMQQMKNWGWGTIDDNWDHGRLRQRSKAFLAYCGRLGGTYVLSAWGVMYCLQRRFFLSRMDGM